MGDFTRKKRRLRGKRDWQFDDGSAYLTEPAVRREPRRAKQLCAQITDALQLALVGDTDDVIRDLSLISVTQYGDLSRILLTFALPRGSTLADVHVAEERLSLAKGRCVARWRRPSFASERLTSCFKSCELMITVG